MPGINLCLRKRVMGQGGIGCLQQILKIQLDLEEQFFAIRGFKGFAVKFHLPVLNHPGHKRRYGRCCVGKIRQAGDGFLIHATILAAGGPGKNLSNPPGDTIQGQGDFV